MMPKLSVVICMDTCAPSGIAPVPVDEQVDELPLTPQERTAAPSARMVKTWFLLAQG